MEEAMSVLCMKGGAKCVRWNPTAEQVKVLTDLFRSGLRTPTTEQIQNISAQLSFYGKIESKNVFYWFQNHKARERQKRRRISIHQLHSDLDIDFPIPKHCMEGVAREEEEEKPIQTLQLFPLNSCEEAEKARMAWKERKEAGLSLPINKRYLKLDLRLSSI